MDRISQDTLSPWLSWHYNALVSALPQTISVKYFSVWLGAGSPPVALCRLVLIQDVLADSDVLVSEQGVQNRDHKC